MRNLLRRTVCLGIIGFSVLAFVARADDNKEEKKAVKLSFKQVWQIEVPTDTKQIGVADVMGDKKYHLLTLGKDGVLTIHDLSGDKPKEKEKVELGKTVTSFLVGNFIKDKPAIIAIEGAYFVRGNDGTYTKNLKNMLRPINGLLRPYDKVETLYSKGLTDKPKEFVFVEKGDKTEVNDKEMSRTKGYYNIVTIRIPKEDAKQYPLSPGVSVGGFNIFADKVEDTAYLLTVLIEEEKQSLCLYDFKQMSMAANAENIKPVWIGPRIADTILDFVVGNNPKDAKQMGAFVLTESKDDAKKHNVTFFVRE